MTTPPESQNFLRPSEGVLEDDILGIYQQLQDIAETVILPRDEAKLMNVLDDNNFNEIEGFYKEIEHKEQQIKILVEISKSLLAKTKDKIINKEQEMNYIDRNMEILENEINYGRERLVESNEMVTSLNDQKEQLESFLDDLDIGYEKTQENLFRSQEEFISLGEYKKKFQELNALLDQNNELLSFYKQTNEDLKKEYKCYKVELANNKLEIEGIRKKLTLLLENYEKSIGKQTVVNKQKLYLQDQISKIKEDIKSIQHINAILMKEIEKDQLKRIKGIPKIDLIGFSTPFKETPKNRRVFKNSNNCFKTEKSKDSQDKLSIDILLEMEEKDKNSQEQLQTSNLFKKDEKIEKKTQKIEELDENKNGEFSYEKFNSLKNSMEINVTIQKSEELAFEADESKYLKQKNLLNLKNNRNSKESSEKKMRGMHNLWLIGGLTVFVSLLVIIKSRAKMK